MANKEIVLSSFINSNKFKGISKLNNEEIAVISFGVKHENTIVEVIKKMIHSYCNEESSNTVIKKMNIELDNIYKDLNR